MSKFRRRIRNKRKDKRIYSRTAVKTHKFNLPAVNTRGGIRL